MSQEETVGDLEQSVGYLLKRTSAALRVGMDAALRPLDLTVPQYSCLEVLGQTEGLSNSELSRRVFVTRQAMDGVLRGLRERGLVTRAETAPQGRALPTRLTDRGRRQLQAASTAVRSVEQQMLTGLTREQERGLRESLTACAVALSPPPGG